WRLCRQFLEDEAAEAWHLLTALRHASRESVRKDRGRPPSGRDEFPPWRRGSLACGASPERDRVGGCPPGTLGWQLSIFGDESADRRPDRSRSVDALGADRQSGAVLWRCLHERSARYPRSDRACARGAVADVGTRALLERPSAHCTRSTDDARERAPECPPSLRSGQRLLQAVARYR